MKNLSSFTSGAEETNLTPQVYNIKRTHTSCYTPHLIIIFFFVTEGVKFDEKISSRLIPLQAIRDYECDQGG